MIGLDRDADAGLDSSARALRSARGPRRPASPRTSGPPAVPGDDDDAVGLERGRDVDRVERVGDALLVGRRRVEAASGQGARPQPRRTHALGDAAATTWSGITCSGIQKPSTRPPLELVQPDRRSRRSRGGVRVDVLRRRQVGRRDPAQAAALEDLALASCRRPRGCSASSFRQLLVAARHSNPSWSSMSAQACASHSLET